MKLGSKVFNLADGLVAVSFTPGGNELINDLGVKGVDLYCGARYSSAVDLRNYATPEQIKRATMHTTNKAFERYFQVSKEELQEMYEHSNCDTPVIQKKKRHTS